MTAFLKPWQRALVTVGRLKTLVIDALTTELAKYGLYAHGGAAAPDSVGVVLWNHDADRPSLYCVASATNAAVDIDGTSGNAESRMIDGNGRVAAPGALGTFQVLASSAVDYELGCMVVDVPSSVTENLNVPGTYNYDQVTSQVGYTAAAGTVTNPSGTQLKIIVDNLLDGTEGDCSALSDTTVRVMLKAVEDGGGVGPQATSGWFEDLAIQWDGSNNYVQTTTYLGQSTPSTTSADYAIYALGPICRRVSTGLPSGAARFAVYTGGGTGAVVTDVAGYETVASSGVRAMPKDGSETNYRLATKRGRGTGVAAVPALAVGGLVESNTAESTTVSNTSSMTWFDTSVTMAGNTMRPGDTLDFEFLAEISALGAGGTVDWAVRLDSTAFFALSHGTPSPGHFVHIKGTLQFLDTGSGNVGVRAIALVSMGSADDSTGGTAPELYEDYHSAITVTSDRELRLGVQFGTADATNTAVCHIAKGVFHGPVE